MRVKRTRVWHRDAKFRELWLGILTEYPSGLFRVTFYTRHPTFGGLTPKRSHGVASRKHYDAECLQLAETRGYVLFRRSATVPMSPYGGTLGLS